MADNYTGEDSEPTTEGTTRRDLSISMAAANLYALLFFFPVALLGALYLLIWGDISFEFVASAGAGFSIILVLAVIVAGIVVHELLHAITWVYLGNKSWQSIKFGVIWKVLTPYAHLQEPIEIRAYRWASAMPGILLGLLPSLIGIVTGVGPIMLFGLFFTFAAAGDTLILWITRGVESGKLVEDHPDRAGCYVLDAQ